LQIPAHFQRLSPRFQSRRGFPGHLFKLFLLQVEKALFRALCVEFARALTPPRASTPQSHKTFRAKKSPPAAESQMLSALASRQRSTLQAAASLHTKATLRIPAPLRPAPKSVAQLPRPRMRAPIRAQTAKLAMATGTSARFPPLAR